MIRLAAIAIAAGLVVAVACGGSEKDDGNQCDALAAKLCASHAPATCDQIATWLRGVITGPDGAPLEPADADRGCKMILDDPTLYDAYTREAAEDLAGGLAE